MENKPSMSRVERLHREKVTRYSIRKYSFGAASVAVAALFMFLGNGAVSVQADQIQPGDTAAAQPATPTLDKTQLESYISEIETKLSNGSYDNKTEESVAVLKADLEAAKTTLANATTQAELKQAYSKLVTTANSKLRNKPVEKKETPAVDTTEGKETVGKSAENTEKKTESNSIENTGFNDARNGKEMDKENALRTETTKTLDSISYTMEFSNDSTKEIYLYNEEDANVNITVNSTAGKITKAGVKGGSGQFLNKSKKVDDPFEAEEIDGWGWTYHSILDATQGPAPVRVTGKPNEEFKKLPAYTKQESQHAGLGDRYLQVYDDAGAKIEKTSGKNALGYFRLVVKSQTYKYSIKLPESNADKIAVSNIDSLTEADIAKIKEKIKIQYSDIATTQDARLASHRGEVLADKNTVVAENGITVENGTVTVTYKDGSVDTTPVADVARTNEPPTVEIPYSDAANREIYVYGAEENSFNIKIKDDSDKVAKATLEQWGSNAFKPVDGETDKINTQYGYTANEFKTETPASDATPAVITYSGTPKAVDNLSQDRLDAATRGETPQGLALGWRYVAVTDVEGTKFAGSGKDAANDHAFRVMLKPQTQKYDVTTPAEESAKFPVVDANNVTDAEFKKIVGENNANIKLHYSAKNTDANLVTKQGQNVDDKADKIKSVTKVDNNMVVTYKDGSTDTLPLTKFARTNEAPTVEIPYSVDGKKDVYVYANEDFEIPIKFKDDSGKIASANVLRGGNNESPVKDASNPNVLNNEFNTTVEKISTETVATAENPAIVKIQGNISKDNSGILASSFPKEQDQELKIVTRYATATDTDGAYIFNTSTSNSYATDPGSFTIKLKAQTAKYDIKVPETKVPVVDANNVTEAEFNEIKKNIKIQYSAENPDKNLADKKGKEVENQDDRIESITKDGNNVVVTYKDGSKDTKPLTDFARTNPAPTVELPYSNPDKKQIYVYTGENTDLTFTGKDETEVKDLYLRGPGDVTWNNTTGFGFTTGKVENGVVTGDGTVTADKRTATIKMTGTTNLKAGQQWTSFIEAKDSDDAKSMTGANYNAETDDAARQQKPGYVQFVVKSQTDKYDIKAPTEKVAVTDPANVTEAELAKIKEKLQLEHNKNNDDANISKDAPVTDKDAKIASVTKDDQGNLVVTYTDGSTDKKPLSEFVTLDKQPAINEVNKAAEKQIEAINNNPEATKEEKDKAIEQVNADKAKALEDIANSTATTKPELDKVEKAGTDKIKTDNPVLSKKPAAKQAIDDALAAKNKAIDARPDLTPEEKTKAKEAAKAAADKAKEAVDAAKTNADVDTAAGKIGDELKKVNPVAKEAAKKAIADELAKKEKAIDARTDLTKEEKDAAKKEAQDKAKEATDAINKQPDIAETPEKATEAQTAVDGAKDKGVADVKAVNPVAAKKAEAKQAIDDALTAKNQEIDARTDLTPEEKTKAKEAAKAAADKAKEAVDAATTNAAVDKAKADGTTAVANVTPVAKAEAKKAINDALTAKNKEIDARTDLTDEEKTAAKNEAKDKADAQLAKINEQPDAATTPTAAKTAQDAVDAAKKTGVDEVTAVNPEAVKKPAAKKAIDDALKAKEAAIDARPDLTDDEKKAAKDVAKDAADKAKEAIDAAPSNAAVDAAKKTGVDKVAAVNPEAVKKPAAKKAIDDALKAKEAAIDARPDLTDDEKKAAKEAAKDAADKAKEAIDAAPSNAEVDKAKEAGTGEIAKVNPVAKEAAKKAVADELAKKEAEIAGRNDLTDEEKTKAKEEAQAKAKEATDAIDAQPSNAETPEAAAKAQTAVDGAKDKGVADVEAVNPEAKAKPEAKQSIDDALKAKEAAIDARTDLTDDEKKAAKDAAKDAADKAKDAIDAAPSNAEVEKAKAAGTGEIAKVNPVAKEAAKKAVADELAKKEEEIAGRNDLTDEEKAKAKEEAQAKAKEATDEIDAQPSNAETPEKAAEAQTAVDGAKDKGVADVKAVNPEAKTKPAAKQAIEDKLAKQLEDIANTPDATDEEKKVAADAAKALADQAKEEIDNAKTDADVKKLQDEAKEDIEKSVPVVEDKPNARKAIDEEATAKKAEIDARNDLTPKAKAKLKAKVDKVAEKSKAAIDAVSSVDDVNTIEEADKAAIKAIGEVNRPIDKVLVKDPSALTDEEKAKILEEVKKVNPTAKEVKYDENGNIEVTTEAGDKGIINPTKLVKTEDQLDNGKGGNDINKPLDKVVVKDPSNLTDEEKAKIVAKVEEVNPDAIVTIDEDGTVSVSTPDGKTAAIPASELVRTKEDTAKPDAGNSKIVKPADKVAGEANDPDDQAKAEEKLRELNPETKSVKFDENGNATVTLKDGTTATIPSEDLFKSEVDATKPNAGNDIVKPADKVVVDPTQSLSDDAKKAIADKVKAVNPGAEVVVDDKGNATVTTPEGKTAVIPASDLTKSPEDAAKPNAGNDIVKPADKVVVDPTQPLSDDAKKAIADKVKAVNPGAEVVVDDKGNATVTTPEGKTAVIPAADLTKDPAAATKPNAGNDIVKPADKTAVKDPANLTPEEKKAIEDKVKAVNPGATVVVDDKGNATVTTPEGNTAVIPATDLTKSPADAAKANAGNTVNTPAAKVEVKDPAKLTDEEKAKVKEAIEAVNPGSKVVVDDKGNVTVTTPEGKTATIPATDLTKSASDAGKANAGNGANTPATKTVVKDPANLTDEEKAKVKKAVEDVNPGSTVVVNDKGDVIVTKGDGTVLVIPELDLVIPEDKLTDPTQQNGVNTPATRVLVGDKAKLTADEIEKVKESIKAVNPGSTVVVDENGNATVTTPEGKTATIPAAQLVKDAKDVAAKNNGENINVDFEKETVADFNNLTDAEKEAAKAKIKGANADVVEVIFDKAGNATVITKDGKVYTIVAKDIFKQRPSADNGSSANAGQTASAQANARKVAQELPNTGTADSTVAMVAAAASALLGLGLAGRRRKEDEEA